MDFSQAEEKFKELQARVQRGEPLTEEQYQEEMQKLMVQDDRGTFWSLDPGTGEWLYFNGTEWVPGTPPKPKPPVTPAPFVPTGTAAGAGAPATEAAAGAADLAAQPFADAAAQTPAAETETVPTYERPGEAQPGGIPPRPIRGTGLPFGDDNSMWLPFAIGAVVLLLCAIALFFGVRNAPFFSTAAAKSTPTVIVQVVPSPTEEAPTDTPAAVTPTRVVATPTPKVVKVTLTDRLRVRQGPGTTFTVLDTLDSGTSLVAVGRNADSSWLQVQLPNTTDLGWVSAQYVTVNGDVNSLPVVQDPGQKPAGTKATPTETPAG